MKKKLLIITSVMMLSIGFVPQAFSEESPTPAPTEESAPAKKSAAEAAKAAKIAEKKAAKIKLGRQSNR